VDGAVAVGARAEEATSGGPAARPAAGPGRRCVVVAGGGMLVQVGTGVGDMGSFAARELVEGQYYSRLCEESAQRWAFDGGFVYRRAEARPADVVAVEALASIEVPAPVPSTSPGLELPQVVGLPTWLWIDPASWIPLEATVDAGGFGVTATVTPRSVTWDMGEDAEVEPVVCDGPGQAYDLARPDHLRRSDCTYTYRWASDTLAGTYDTPDGLYHASVTTTWGVAWRTSDGQSGVLADISRTTPFSVRVTEIQAAICHSEPRRCNDR